MEPGPLQSTGGLRVLCLQSGLVASISVLLLVGCATAAGKFTVVGPNDVISVNFGEDAVLPCHLVPSMSAENMEVRWFRSRYQRVVHLYHDGEDHPEVQMQQYHQRTELLKRHLTKGRAELKIHQVRLADAGSYTCFFQSETFYHDAQLELVLTGFGSIPHLHIENYDDGGIRVACCSKGWYPEPKAQWLDAQSKHLAPLADTWSADENGLFYGAISLLIGGQSNRNVSCVIRNTITKQEQAVIVSISEGFFTPVSVSTVILIVIVVIVLSGLVPLGYFIYKYRKYQEENEIIRAMKHRVTVTMDSDTAHPELHLSNQMKTVTRGEKHLNLGESPERFDTRLYVLGSEEYTSGQQYWEMEVKNGTGWTVGVALRSIDRKGKIDLSPQEGFCVLELKNQRYGALTTPKTSLEIKTELQKVGVYLNCEGAKVSFFNARTLDHIHTFHHSFSGEPVLPFFSLWSREAEITVC